MSVNSVLNWKKTEYIIETTYMIINLKTWNSMGETEEKIACYSQTRREGCMQHNTEQGWGH